MLKAFVMEIILFGTFHCAAELGTSTKAKAEKKVDRHDHILKEQSLKWI